MIVHYLTAHQIMYYCKFVKAIWPVRRRCKREEETHRHARKWPHPGSANERSHRHRDTTGRICVRLSVFLSVFYCVLCLVRKKIEIFFCNYFRNDRELEWRTVSRFWTLSILHSTAGDATKASASQEQVTGVCTKSCCYTSGRAY